MKRDNQKGSEFAKQEIEREKKKETVKQRQKDKIIYRKQVY